MRLSPTFEQISKLTEADIDSAFCSELENSELLAIGRLLWVLVEQKKWPILQKICAQLSAATLAKFKTFIGMHLKTYLTLNIPDPIPDNLIKSLEEKINETEIQLPSFLPQQLTEDLEHSKQLIQRCSDFFQVKEDAFWRLSIDHAKQDSNHPYIFDVDEPGYLAGLINGWHHVMLTWDKPLTLESLIQLHDAAVIYRSIDGRYGRVFNKKQEPFKLGIGLGGQGESGWYYIKLPETSKNALEENTALASWLFETFNKNSRIYIRGQWKCHQDVVEKTTRIFTEYHTAIHAPGADETQKLKAIALLCKQLEMFHIFPDGNQRTIAFLLLNQELKRHGMGMCILPDPTCFDGPWGVDDIVEKIRVGQQLAKIHLDPSIDQNTALTCLMKSLTEQKNHSQLFALRVITALLTQRTFRTLVRPFGIIPKLIDLLLHADNNYKSEDADALLNRTAYCPESQSAIREVHGMALIGLLRSNGSDAVKENAAEALWRLAAHCPENQSAIREAQGIPALIRVVRSNASDAVKEKAAGALWSLAAHCPKNRSAIREAQGIPALIGLVRSNASDAVKENVAGALCNLAINCPENQSAICDAQGIPVLIELLRSDASDPVKNEVAAILWNLVDCIEMPLLHTLLLALETCKKRVSRETTPLHIAADRGSMYTVRALIDAGADKNAAQENGVTPLYAAARKNHIEVVNALILARADVNLRCINGATPLFIAAHNGHLEVVKALIDAGADIEAAGTNNTTPLFIASQRGHTTVVRVLLAHGANKNNALHSGETPLDAAIRNDHKDVAAILLNLGVEPISYGNRFFSQGSGAHRKYFISSSQPLTCLISNQLKLSQDEAQIIKFLYSNPSP